MPDRIAQIVFLLTASAAFATHGCAKSHQDEHARELATRVRTEFLHAWNNYERYAWGHDALRPLSKTVRRSEDVARCDQPDLVRQSSLSRQRLLRDRSSPNKEGDDRAFDRKKKFVMVNDEWRSMVRRLRDHSGFVIFSIHP